MRTTALSLAILVGTCVVAGAQAAKPPAAQATTGPQESQGITRQQADDILKELKGIRQLLERLSLPPRPAGPQAPPSDVTVRLGNIGAFMLGRPDAPLTLVEFTDLQCPFCNQFATTTFDQIKKAYIDTGKLRYVTRDFPLGMHPEAARAARACRCAADQKKFWEMRTLLARAEASKLSRDFMVARAAELKLDAAAFTACLDSDRYQAEVTKDMNEGAQAGVQGTPSFVLGRTTGSQMEGTLFSGAMPFAAFDARIKAMLAAPPPKPPDQR